MQTKKSLEDFIPKEFNRFHFRILKKLLMKNERLFDKAFVFAKDLFYDEFWCQENKFNYIDIIDIHEGHIKRVMYAYLRSEGYIRFRDKKHIFYKKPYKNN